MSKIMWMAMGCVAVFLIDTQIAGSRELYPGQYAQFDPATPHQISANANCWIRQGYGMAC